MRKQELRIGNKIKIDGIIVTVDERTLFDFDHDGRVKESVEITEEWLEKFGFEKETEIIDEVENYDYTLVAGKGVLFRCEWNLHGILEYIYIDDLCFIEIQYVHQLQNLYFALTGEELQ
jgi:hypothetical protein